MSPTVTIKALLQRSIKISKAAITRTLYKTAPLDEQLARVTFPWQRCLQLTCRLSHTIVATADAAAVLITVIVLPAMFCKKCEQSNR